MTRHWDWWNRSRRRRIRKRHRSGRPAHAELSVAYRLLSEEAPQIVRARPDRQDPPLLKVRGSVATDTSPAKGGAVGEQRCVNRARNRRMVPEMFGELGVPGCGGPYSASNTSNSPTPFWPQPRPSPLRSTCAVVYGSVVALVYLPT